MQPLEGRALLASLLSVSIGDAQVVEGNDNTHFAFFNIDLNSITTSSVSVQYQTADGTAKAGQDYTAVSGTAIFSSGQRSIAIGVPILGDTLPEADETFTLNLSNGIGAPIARSQGTATIIDDDSQSVFVSANPNTTTEGSTQSGIFNITRAGPTDAPLKVYYSVGGTATNGTDYTRLKGVATIAAGKTSVNVSVKALDDLLDENSETVVLTLKTKPAYSVGSPKSATITIADRDHTAPVAHLVAGDVTASGSDPYQFSVIYDDNRLIKAATVGNGDVQIVGPNGFVQSATLVSKTPSKNSSEITAVYQITPPGGAWDAADNGAYTISVVSKQVSDSSGNFIAAGSIGGFHVSIS